MNNIEFTYHLSQDDDLYREQLLSFFNVSEDDLFTKIDSIYLSLDFDLTPVYDILKKKKQFQFFAQPEYLFLFLFSYDYLYLFGPILYSILHNFKFDYDSFIQKLNNI